MSESYCMTRDQFLEEYTFEVDPKHDFHLAGTRAEWAVGHPLTWDRSSDSIEVPQHGEDSNSYEGYCMAISSDEVLLAVTAGRKVYVYDIESRELRQELDGSGKVFFRPLDMRGDDVGETEVEEGNEGEMVGGPRYMLVCSVPEVGTLWEGRDLMFWEIDKNGRLLDEDEPIDASALAVKAVESIVADLTTRHEWTPEFIAASTLTADIQAALKKVETKHRIAQNTKVDTAKFTGFGSTPFNQDGTRLLYVTRNLSQSSASRGALQPHVAVWDVNVGKELFRMQGHTDEIMWAGFNPDGSRIATVSWDGTLRMHNGHTGSLHWASPNSGGQSWAGDFSPDGKHIVWSSKGGQSIRVFDVEKGECQATFPLQVRNWVRSLEWNPDGRSIAIGGFSAYVWHPFGGTPAGTVELEVRVKSDGPATFASFDHVKWLDDAKLAVGCSDGSIVVWDHYSNLKEGFLRPHGLIAEGYAGLETHFLKEKETYLTLNNDGIVRFWRHTVPASLNNTKKRKSTVPDGPSKVTTIPEHDKAPVDDWLEKGAELWTAE